MVAKLAPLVVIVGETASGKSELAMYLAKQFGGEIIAADSWTVRREVNIGTAKPSLEDRRAVSHHLIDITDPCEDFTAAVFKKKAVDSINEIDARGKLPIMVGGTGLYIDGVLFNYGFLPEKTRQERAKLSSLPLNILLEIAKSKSLPLQSIDTRNKRRVIRLIETNGAEPSRESMRGNCVIIGVSCSKDELEKRIERRVDNMIKHGLEDEVRLLSEKYGWGCEALKGVGYKEWRSYLEGEANLEDVRDHIIRSTKQLAKRQRTWFKRNKSIHWVTKRSEAVELVTTLLRQN